MKKSKLLAILLALAMTLSLMPTVAVAEGEPAAWDGTAADQTWYSEEETSFTLTTAAQLAGLAQLVNAGKSFSGKTVTLGADIDLGGKEWTPIGQGTRNGSGYTGNAFKGTFNGDGKTISGLKVTSSAAKAALGLFGVVDGGTVKGLELANVSITATTGADDAGAVGGAIGLIAGGENTATVENMTVSGNITGVDGVGGIVGRMTVSGTIEDCTNGAVVNSAYGGAGGIVGKAYYTGADKEMTISRCKNTGTITDGYAAGGIAGFSAANVSSCTNEASISSGKIAGGIVGEQTNFGTISSNLNSGAVSNKVDAAGTSYGGIVGWIRYQNNSTAYPRTSTIVVSGNTSSGTVSAPKAELGTGGIVGTAYNQATVTGNENKAVSITGGAFTAGILGDPQQNSDNLSITSETIKVYNNVSSTGESVTGQVDSDKIACVHPYMWNNVPAAFKEENNSAAWVAKIGTVNYATLSAAVAAAADSDTITLLSNVTLGETLVLNSDKVLTIDLNQKTLSATNRVINVRRGTLNLIGTGTVKENTPDYAPIVIHGSETDVADYSVVNVGENVTLEGWAGVFISPNNNHAYGVKVSVDGDIVSKKDSGGHPGAGVYINGTIKDMTGNVPEITLGTTCDITAEENGSGGIYAAGYAKWTLSGDMTAGTPLTVKSGDFVINGGTYTANGPFLDPAIGNGNGSENTGAALSMTSNDGYAKKLKVVVNDGEFVSANGFAVYEGIAIKDEAPVAVSSYVEVELRGGVFTGNGEKGAVQIEEASNKKVITGGTFSSDPSAYKADGTIVRVNTDSSYTVVANADLTSGTYLTQPNVAAGYQTVQSGEQWTVSRIPSSSGGSSSSGTTVTVPVTSESDSVNVKAEVSKGTATVKISDKQIAQVAADGSGTVTVDVSRLEKVESVSVPAHVVDTTNKAEDTGLTVALPDGSVALDETALESVTTGKDITISVRRVPATDLTEEQQKAVGDMANIGLVVDVDLFVGKEKQSSFNGGKLTITIPYTPKRGEDTSKLTVWFIRDDGTIENKGGYYDAEKKCFVFETDHLSRYVLVSVNEQFTDVAADAYYAAAVNWAVAQNITNGIGDGEFGPDLGCTRAQIVTFLYRCAVAQGVDVSVGESTNVLSYTDALEVPEFAFEAFQWAVGAGIIQGADGKLMPNDDCTRAQIVTMLYRYTMANGDDVSIGESTNILSYADALEVPEYAVAPFQWACGANIIQGADGKLMPSDTCTRGQIVTMLYRLLGK